MNKRFLTVLMLGVFFSPGALAATESTVLFEAKDNPEAARKINGLMAGENSDYSGTGTECAALANARRARLAEAQGLAHGTTDAGVAR